MRGKGFGVVRRNGRPRITPAYAGKRATEVTRNFNKRDHPRVCGEKTRSRTQRSSQMGSPPRMRGKDHPHVHLMIAVKDHPRVCGEKMNVDRMDMGKLGSPPRMRGKACTPHDCGQQPGITPAYAGKRLKRSRSTVPPVAIVPLFPSVCNKPVVSDGSPAGRDAPLFLPAENAVPASPAYNLRSL